VEYDPAGRFVQQIQQHYQRASKELLTMMLSHFQLKGWLQSCKNFFLLHQGDYFTNFLDVAESELEKEVYRTSMSLLRGQHEMAVKTSSLAHDAHSDKLQFVLDPKSLIDLHSVRSSFSSCASSLLLQCHQHTASQECCKSRKSYVHPLQSLESLDPLDSSYVFYHRFCSYSQFVHWNMVYCMYMVGRWRRQSLGASACSSSVCLQAVLQPKTNVTKNAKNVEKMKAADLIMLELAVQWPISIVLTPHNLRAFQLCFRHLVNVKVSKHFCALVQLNAFPCFPLLPLCPGLLVSIAVVMLFDCVI
jgi:uncharacterized protein YjaG (DUF416 family)